VGADARDLAEAGGARRGLFGAPLIGAVVHHDADARLGQADGDRAADPVTGSGDEGDLPLEVDRYHCSGERVRTGELMFDVPVGMLESVERSTFTLARLAERMAVELHVGVV